MPGLEALHDWTIDCYRTVVGATALEVLGDGNNGVPSDGVAESCEIVSADPLDDFANAAGWARQLRIAYISTTDGTLKTTTANLSGATPVSVGVADMGPVVRLDCVAFGTGGKTNKGIITLKRTSGALGRAAIRAARTSAALGQFKVPAGFKAKIIGLDFTAANSNALEIIVTADVDPFTFVRTPDIYSPVPGFVFHNKQQFWMAENQLPNRSFPAGTLIIVKAQTVSSTSDVAGAVNLRLTQDLDLAA